MRIGILTSGGDAPGMNAEVRAVARTAFFRGWEVIGLWAGYRGLLEGRIYPMDRRRFGGTYDSRLTVVGPSSAVGSRRPQTGYSRAGSGRQRSRHSPTERTG